LAVVVAVVGIAAFLIFFRLDQRLLWVDEAETALLGRSILVHGVPTAWDGRNLISQEVGREFGPDYVWYWTPWLDKYLAAASFALLGESTFSARLPFAILGLLSVVSIYPLGFVLFRDRWIAVLAMAFLALSVPFLLHVRQCRYYSAVILCSIWALYFFVGLARGRRFAVAGFVVATLVLFQASVLSAAATVAAFAPCAVVQQVDRAVIRRYLLTLGLVVLGGVSSAYVFTPGVDETRILTVVENLRAHLDLTNRYTFPFAALAALPTLAWLARRFSIVRRDAWRPCLLLVLFMSCYLLVVSLAPWSFYRYTVALLVPAAILSAFIAVSMVRWQPIAGSVFMTSLLFTTLIHQALAAPLGFVRYNLHLAGRSFPAYDIMFPLGNFLHEVTHPYRGPMEQLVALLAASASPADRVFITYGDLILAFYTNLEIRGGQSGRPLAGWAEPEWVVVRSFFRFSDRPALRADAARMRVWLERDVPVHRYRVVPGPSTDVPWDNIPEPQLHWYRVPEGGRPMMVARRVAP
jgi:hypothetical protein